MFMLRRVLGVMLLIIIVSIIFIVFSRNRPAYGDKQSSSLQPPFVQCVPAPNIQAPPPLPLPSPDLPQNQTSMVQKPVCPPGYVPQPIEHSAPKGMPRP
jgi:hypothetical protein